MICSLCGTTIQASSRAHGTRMVSCASCQAVYSMMLDPSPLALASEEGWAIKALPGRLRLTRKWFSLRILCFAILLMAADGFLVYWFHFASRYAKPITVDYALCLTGLLAVLTYMAIAWLVNRTTYDIQPLCLQREHGPLPWPGGETVSHAKVRDYVCRARLEVTDLMNYQIVFDILASSKQGKHQAVIKGLRDARLAFALEHAIESVMADVGRH